MAFIEPAQSAPENGSGGRWTAPPVEGHAAEARRLAGVGDRSYGRIEHYSGSGVSEGVEALLIVQVAQVHATLALAEQQRIANLIALALAPADISVSFFNRALGHGPDARSLEDLADEIRKGLYPDDNA